MKIKVTHNEKDWRPDEADIGLEKTAVQIYISGRIKTTQQYIYSLQQKKKVLYF